MTFRTRPMALAACLLTLSTLPTFATAADVGVGVGAGQAAELLYLTVRLPSGLRIEPYFGTYRSKSELIAVQSTSTNSFTSAGIGLYGSHRPSDAIEVFAGSRLGYTRSRNQISSPSYESSGHSSGHVVAPTAGFEYFFHRQVSVGAEVSYFINRSKGQETYSGITSDIKSRTHGTTSAITLRYYAW